MNLSNTKQLISAKSGQQCDYLVVDELPTNFRSYDTKEVFVRGLYYEESVALAKYIGYTNHPPISQLVSIYSDAIRGVELNKLELVDFIVLMIISSIYTTEDFGWDPNIQCSHFLPNTYRCQGMINDKIVLDDFDFDDPLVDQLPIPVPINGKELQIGAITVGDMNDKEGYLKKDPDIDKKILDYAMLIKNEDMSFEEKVNLVKFTFPKDLKVMKQIDSEIHITMKPLEKKCPSCGNMNRLRIGLTQIRGYP